MCLMNVHQFIYFKDDDRYQPIRVGVKIRHEELLEMQAHLDEFNEHIHKLKDVTICLDQDKHDKKKCPVCKLYMY